MRGTESGGVIAIIVMNFKERSQFHQFYHGEDCFDERRMGKTPNPKNPKNTKKPKKTNAKLPILAKIELKFFRISTYLLSIT
jgi:hypothetical protein